MPSEIERKFLLKDSSWQSEVQGSREICQAYLSNTGKASVRVRLAGDRANINIKSASLTIERQEFEYPIPPDEARELLELALGSAIRKTRHIVEQGGRCWEIDEFHGDNAGLVVAEIELTHVDETFARPPWLGKEVSDDERYYNVYLANTPYKQWTHG